MDWPLYFYIRVLSAGAEWAAGVSDGAGSAETAAWAPFAVRALGNLVHVISMRAAGACAGAGGRYRAGRAGEAIGTLLVGVRPY